MKKLIAVLFLFSLVCSLYGAVISGKVRDEDSMPYSGFAVYLETDWDFFSTETDSNGLYTFSGVPVGYCWIYPDWGYITTPYDYEVYVESTADTLTGYDFTVTPPPEPDAVIRGRITYSDSTPAYDMEVEAWGMSSYFSYYGYSDDEGYYTVDVPGGDVYYLSCYPWGSYIVEPEEYMVSITTGDTLDGYDFVLYPDTLTEMGIDVFVGDTFYVGIEGVEVSCVHLGGSSAGMGFTDEDGYLFFDIYEMGSYLITPTLAGHTFYPESTIVFVDEFEPWAYVEFFTDSFGTPPPYFSIEVMAYDTAFMPVESLLVEWRPAGGPEWYKIMTDHYGNAYIYVELGGEYHLRASHYDPFIIIDPCSTTVFLSEYEPTAFVFFTIYYTSGIGESPLPLKPVISVFPNPFNSGLRVSATGKAAISALEVFDIKGKLVDRVDFPNYVQSYYWVPPPGCSTGIYFLRIDTGKNVITKRALLVK
ncbi:T9SS type A sorting domain-containing protein [bacterium]|nr:T9SS type A sorting domain-containing protein [bacterium]